MDKFKALRVYQKDDGVLARLEYVAVDDLDRGDVLIKAAYSSVNYKDALAATGKSRIIRRFPCIAGIDVSGHIVESGDERFRAGDKVLVTGYDFGVAHDGGYAKYVRVPAEWVVPLPSGMSLFDAMIIGTAGFTVALCIQRLEENRQTPDLGPFVITGATGGVGSFAIDIMSSLGYEIVAVTGKQERCNELLALGAKVVLDRRQIDFDGSILQKGKWGGAIDNVGGDMLAWLTKTTKPWGNIASVGLAGGNHLHTTVMPFILRGVSLIGISSSACPTHYRQALWGRLADDLAPRSLDKILTDTVTLDDLPRIFETMLSGKTTGRTVVKIAAEE